MVLAIAFAVFIGINGKEADGEREDLRAENDALLKTLEDLRRESEGLRVSSGQSHKWKNLRIKQLEKKLKIYEE